MQHLPQNAEYSVRSPLWQFKRALSIVCMWSRLNAYGDSSSLSVIASPTPGDLPSFAPARRHHQATAERDLCHSYTGQLQSYVLHKPQTLHRQPVLLW